MRLAVLANEFFDPALGPMGGFGWATRQVAEAFAERSDLGVDVVMLCGQRLPSDTKTHGDISVVGRPSRKPADIKKLRRLDPDLILTIDYRPSYRRMLGLFPRTPVIVWARDPRTPYDCARVSTLRLPGAPEVVPQGIGTINCTSLAGLVRFRSLAGGRTMMASPAHYLREKLLGTYGFEPKEWNFLPNPVDLPNSSAAKSDPPSVVFLGRLDPIKRPWLFVELAHRFPFVRFLMLGRNHFAGTGSWQPTDLPENVEMLGHVDGAEKVRIVSSAWALINTSIHEALATSFLEALACKTPLIACVDPDSIVSRFGYYIGRWDGDGLDSLPYFTEAIQHLLDDEDARIFRAEAGCRWVHETHKRQTFVDTFTTLCALLDVPMTSPRPLVPLAARASE